MPRSLQVVTCNLEIVSDPSYNRIIHRPASTSTNTCTLYLCRGHEFQQVCDRLSLTFEVMTEAQMISMAALSIHTPNPRALIIPWINSSTSKVLIRYSSPSAVNCVLHNFQAFMSTSHVTDMAWASTSCSPALSVLSSLCHVPAVHVKIFESIHDPLYRLDSSQQEITLLSRFQKKQFHVHSITLLPTCRDSRIEWFMGRSNKLCREAHPTDKNPGVRINSGRRLEKTRLTQNAYHVKQHLC